MHPQFTADFGAASTVRVGIGDSAEKAGLSRTPPPMIRSEGQGEVAVCFICRPQLSLRSDVRRSSQPGRSTFPSPNQDNWLRQTVRAGVWRGILVLTEIKTSGPELRNLSTSQLEPFSSRRGKTPQEGAPMRNTTINNTNTPNILDITVDGIVAGGVVAGCVARRVKRLYRATCRFLSMKPGLGHLMSALSPLESSSQPEPQQSWFRSHWHAAPAAMPAACLAARPFAIAL